MMPECKCNFVDLQLRGSSGTDRERRERERERERERGRERERERERGARLLRRCVTPGPNINSKTFMECKC